MTCISSGALRRFEYINIVGVTFLVSLFWTLRDTRNSVYIRLCIYAAKLIATDFLLDLRTFALGGLPHLFWLFSFSHVMCGDFLMTWFEICGKTLCHVFFVAYVIVVFFSWRVARENWCNFVKFETIEFIFDELGRETRAFMNRLYKWVGEIKHSKLLSTLPQRFNRI